MKKLATKKMKTGGMPNENTMVTVNKTPTKYTGGKNAAATVNKTATKYTGGKSTAPAGAVPAAKYGKSVMKKGGMVKSKKK